MNEPKVSIGILSSEAIRFELYGDYRVSGSDKKFSGRYIAKTGGAGIEIQRDSEVLISGSEIYFHPDDIETESFLLRDVVIGKNFHWQKKENQRFRGALKLIRENSLLTAVNLIPLEAYLVSVISSEMSGNSSKELLKTHAIISRSWLLAQLEKKKSPAKKMPSEIITEDEIIRWYDREDHTNYDFCADDHCQRYQGIAKILNENALNAVEKTRGLVLTDGNEICDTRYSKCCGGISEAFENVWEEKKYKYLDSIIDYKFELDGLEFDLTKERDAERWIKGNPNAFCNTTDRRVLSQILVDFDRATNNFFRWKVEMTQQQISELIKKKSGVDFGAIIDFIPVARGKSGRIIKLKIAGTAKTLTVGKELEIRRYLSESHLYSSAFITRKENIVNGIPQKFILYGAGWGHGVGLCQIGAAMMGEMGYKFDEILLHYFRGAKIQKVY